MIEYKPKTATVILNVMVVVVFILIVLFFKNFNNILCFIGLVSGIYFIMLFFKKRVISFKVYTEKKEIIIIRSRCFLLKSQEKYMIESIYFSFEDQIGARGVKTKELRFFEKDTNKKIITLVPNFDGWSIGDLEKIFNDLTLLSKFDDSPN
jgi:hypothetical protein